MSRSFAALLLLADYGHHRIRQIQDELMRQIDDFRHEVYTALYAGDYTLLSPTLRPVLTCLLSHGYHILRVQPGWEEGRFDVVLDHPITEEFREIIPVSDELECFDDFDEWDVPMGIGFLCRPTYQTIIS